MNIKDHIEAGHYPLDLRKRPLVETREESTYTIVCTDRPGDYPIVGFCAANRDSYQSWTVDGRTEVSVCDRRVSYLDLLPPSPRKVALRFVARINGGLACYCQPDTPENRQEARDRQREYGGHVVTLTGEYEEPWS